MTDTWRGARGELEAQVDAFFRERWAERSVWVLNIDKVICDPWVNHGVLIELKHVDAPQKFWRATRSIAQRLGWWSAMFEHDWTQPLFATVLPPDGPMIERHPFDAERFDSWVCREFGAVMR